MLRCAALASLLTLAATGCAADPQPPVDAGDAGAGGSPDAGDAGPHHCTFGFLGDPTKDPELELIALGADGVSSPIKDGDTIALIFPIQGGRVIFAGARATNLAACGVQLAGAVRDLTSMQVRIDSRTVNLRPTGDGWGVSDDDDQSSFANVPLCPNQWSDTDVFATEYQLIITLTDRDQRTVTKTAKVKPACAEPDHAAECFCTCQGGYVLGQKCDGGAPDAGDPEGGAP